MDAGDETLAELGSFNLSLGDLGQARLVAKVDRGQDKDDPKILVSLSFLEDGYQGEPLKIRVSRISITGDGELADQVCVKKFSQDL